MKHAIVKIGDYTIPLIGIPESATEQKCAKCKNVFHLTKIALDYHGKPLCEKRRKLLTT